MKKIDKRLTYYCVLDTETCPIDRNIEGVNAKNMLVYDIGYRIIDKKGNCYLERQFVVNEIFFGEKEKMDNSYYKDKLPTYYKKIKNKEIKKANILQIKTQLRKDLEKYNCKIVSAHNAYFDYTALQNTINYLYSEIFNQKLYFFPYGITLWDTLKMSRDTICKQKSYPFYTSNGRKSATAENLYRYISGNYDFKEKHNGLDDTKIESVILVECLKQHKKMRKTLWK